VISRVYLTPTAYVVLRVGKNNEWEKGQGREPSSLTKGWTRHKKYAFSSVGLHLDSRLYRNTAVQWYKLGSSHSSSYRGVLKNWITG